MTRAANNYLMKYKAAYAFIRSQEQCQGLMKQKVSFLFHKTSIVAMLRAREINSRLFCSEALISGPGGFGDDMAAFYFPDIFSNYSLNVRVLTSRMATHGG